MNTRSPDGPDALRGIVDVSRETEERLAAFVALLRKWQAAENLISPNTLGQIWSRHVADSAALVARYRDPLRWMDLGTGAGFPGMVVALTGPAGTRVHLVESNRRKCAFLRQAVRETAAPAMVHEGRVEAVVGDWNSPVDRIIARAVAPLDRLLELAAPLMQKGVPAAFHKGADYESELAAARTRWDFDVQVGPNPAGEGVILDISALKRRVESG